MNMISYVNVIIVGYILQKAYGQKVDVRLEVESIYRA